MLEHLPRFRKLPALLLAGLPDAVAGDYAVAIYSVCDTDPSSEDGDTSISLVIEGANGLPEEKTSNTITVSDISFYFDAMYYSSYGSYTLLKSDDGYLSNTTEMTGLSEIIATDDYSHYNLSLYVGASADEVTTLVEYVQSGDDRVYTIPAGNSYFKIVNESSYAAQADSFKFTYDGGTIEFAGNAEGFPTAYPTGSITVEDVTFAYDNCYYSSYGSYTIDKYTDGFFGNTTELIDLKTVTLTDDYTHFNFSLYVGTVAGELAEEVVYEQDGDDRIFTIPSGYGFFTIVNEADYSAYCDKITIKYGSVASSVMAKASATVYTGYSVYTFDGSAWSIPSDSDILAASDYVAMGTTYGNLSSSLDPDTLLPIYLANKYPYASDGDSLDVFYNYYDGTDTAFSVGFYTYLSGAWVNLNTTGISVVESAFNLVDSVWEMNKKTYLYLKDNTGMPDYDYITGEVTEFTVDGVTFEYQNTYYGEYYGSLSIPTGDGYWRNLTEMPGLSMIIVEEDYTYYNLSVYVGTAAGEETTLVEKVQDGNYYYYTIPEGYNFAKFCNETSYSAYCDSITFEFDGLE